MPAEERADTAKLVDLAFKAEALTRHGLPVMLYPVPFAAVDAAIGNDGELPFAFMLAGLQQRCAEGQADWHAAEPALDRLADILSAGDNRGVVTAAGDNWWVEIGPLELGRPMVTIQRRDQLIAAIGAREDGRLRLATYRPLDAKSASYVLGLSLVPDPVFGVCMRDNNWEYACDGAAGIGNVYAFDRGEAHLSYWERGIGISHDGGIDPHWRAMLELAPRRPAMAAVELGVRYALGDT